MRRRVALAFFFVLCFCLLLIFNLPAVHVMAQLKIPENIAFSGLKGSVFRGSLDSLGTRQLQFSNVDYSAELSCLFVLKACYQINTEQGHLHIGVSLIDQEINLQDVEISYRLENLDNLPGQVFIRPSGNLLVNLSSLNIKQQKLGRVNGNIVWQQAGIVGESVELGGYELVITAEDQAYKLELKDKEALLNVDGLGRLKANGQYSLNIKIQSQPGLQQSIKTALEFIAKKRGLNQYDLRRTGTLAKQYLDQLHFESE